MRAENRIHGSDQQSCSLDVLRVMITIMCPRLVFLPITRLAAWLQLSRVRRRGRRGILILRHQFAVLQRHQPRRPNLDWAGRCRGASCSRPCSAGQPTGRLGLEYTIVGGTAACRERVPGRPARRGSCGSPIPGSRGQPEDDGFDVPAGGRSAGLAAHQPGGPAAADDVAAPARDRVRGHQQPQALAPRFRYRAKQAGSRPVRPAQLRAPSLLPLQDGELVAQDQDLGSLSRLLTPAQNSNRHRRRRMSVQP
jgi:hypothetical protein